MIKISQEVQTQSAARPIIRIADSTACVVGLDYLELLHLVGVDCEDFDEISSRKYQRNGSGDS